MCEWGGAILSPHGALRAYTVFPTAEPLRGSPMAHLLLHRTQSDLSDPSDLSDSPDSSPTFPDGAPSSALSDLSDPSDRSDSSDSSPRLFDGAPSSASDTV